MRYTIATLVEDKPGIMTRMAGLFSRRGFNIESLTVGKTEKTAKSRFTIVVEGDERILNQVIKQLQRLVNVIKVKHIENSESIQREYALVKIKDQIEKRAEILNLVEIFKGKILDASDETLVVEATGNEKDIDTAFKLLEAYNIIESIRTGKISLGRGKQLI